MDTKEIVFNGTKINGFFMLFLHLVVTSGLIVACFFLAKPITYVVGILLILLWIFMCFGYLSLEPNEARVMVFFGKYKGTFKETGFFWVNPFMDKKKLSFRARNLDVEPIKVNDKIVKKEFYELYKSIQEEQHQNDVHSGEEEEALPTDCDSSSNGDSESSKP